jgi:hypothetical protein
VLMGTAVHYLTVEFQRFRRGVSANVEHDKIVDMGLPQKSRSGDLFSFMHLDRVSSQDGGTCLARSLAGVDEENFLARKSRTATKWRWVIHRTPPKRAPLFRRVIVQSVRREGAGVKRKAVREKPFAMSAVSTE